MAVTPDLIAACETIRAHVSSSVAQVPQTPLETARLARGLSYALFDLRNEHAADSDMMMALSIAHVVLAAKVVDQLEALEGEAALDRVA